MISIIEKEMKDSYWWWLRARREEEADALDAWFAGVGRLLRERKKTHTAAIARTDRNMGRESSCYSRGR